jgi:hypothetical protein
MKRTDDLSARIAGRDDADELTATELEMITEGGDELEKMRDWVTKLIDLVAMTRSARTVGDARRIVNRVEELDRMADAL